METLSAIIGRYSETKVMNDPVPAELIKQLLMAAVQAPNHHRVRPWRFVILQGHARHRLGDAMAEYLLEKKPDVDPVILEAERAKPLRAPLIIAVGVDQPTEPRVKEIENISAAAASVQNLLLAAYDVGLGAIWRTGDAVNAPQVKSFLGLEQDQTLLAFVYLGFPQGERKEVLERQSFDDRTTWLSDE